MLVAVKCMLQKRQRERVFQTAGVLRQIFLTGGQSNEWWHWNKTKSRKYEAKNKAKETICETRKKLLWNYSQKLWGWGQFMQSVTIKQILKHSTNKAWWQILVDTSLILLLRMMIWTIYWFPHDTRLALAPNISISTQVFHYKYKLPIAFANYFDLNIQIHDYNTRAYYPNKQ